MKLNYFTELDAYLPLGFFGQLMLYINGESDFAPGGDTETFTINFRKLSEEAANFLLVMIKENLILIFY